MIWWLRNRRIAVPLSCAAAAAVLTILAGDYSIPTPSFLAFGLPAVALALILPLALAITVNVALGRADRQAEDLALRLITALDLSLALATVTVFAVPLLLIEPTNPTSLGAIRNALGLVSCGLLLRTLIPEDVAVVVPVAWTIIAAAFGAGLDNRATWWAWQLADGRNTTSWIFSTALAAAAVTALATWRIRPSRAQFSTGFTS
ncbi:MAG: hypothetical protein ACRDTF_23725 [Pseudonocardiaceae bacterium]